MIFIAVIFRSLSITHTIKVGLSISLRSLNLNLQVKPICLCSIINGIRGGNTHRKDIILSPAPLLPAHPGGVNSGGHSPPISFLELEISRSISADGGQLSPTRKVKEQTQETISELLNIIGHILSNCGENLGRSIHHYGYIIVGVKVGITNLGERGIVGTDLSVSRLGIEADLHKTILIEDSGAISITGETTSTESCLHLVFISNGLNSRILKFEVLSSRGNLESVVDEINTPVELNLLEG